MPGRPAITLPGPKVFFVWASILVAARSNRDIISLLVGNDADDIGNDIGANEMKSKTGKSVAGKAYGKVLETPIPYTFDYTLYENGAELVAAKDEMTLEEQLKARNADRLNNARAKAREKAFEDAGLVKPTAENDPSIAFREMVKTILTAKLPDGSRKFTQEQAEEQASMLLGYDPNADETAE